MKQRRLQDADEYSDWLNTKWRPMVGWVYMTVCIADFIVFPILWSLLQSAFNGQVTAQWQPLTLQGAGLFHVAMGTVLGIAAYGRTQEKINGILGPGTTYQQAAMPSNPGPALPVQALQSEVVTKEKPTPIVNPSKPAVFEEPVPEPVEKIKGKYGPPLTDDPVL